MVQDVTRAFREIMLLQIKGIGYCENTSMLKYYQFMVSLLSLRLEGVALWNGGILIY